MSLYPGVALITGAASGISQATAVSFAREGCTKLVLGDRDEQGLERTQKLIEEAIGAGKAKVLAIRTDVTSAEQIDHLVLSAVKEFGRIDYAVNGAGVLSNNKRSHDTTLEEFDFINSVNYRGCWLSSRAAIKQMLTQDPLPTHDGRPGSRGSIVNIASQLGVVGRPAAPAYCGSKAAYSKDLIRVNSVCPGVIDTPMTKPNAEVLEPAVSIAPMERMGTAQEVADCVLFLASSKASFVQGAAMVVDGGYTIN
ncbi:hypothetical protein Q7P37_005785 [Cladosporium fusiforme]